MTPDLFALHRGHRPLLMSLPHSGTFIPPGIANRMTAAGHLVADTDWHLPSLYDFAVDLGISVIEANYSRYVIDLNRSPDNRPFYAGANNTELVPTTTFANEPIYTDDTAPGSTEIAERRTTYWALYHDRIEAELAAIRDRHSVAVLFDSHSIRSQVPRFFDGTLPDFNLGTAEKRSCDSALRDRLDHVLRTAPTYTLAVDGRFKGGYITRHYGRPTERLHAFQLELSQATYMDEDPPFAYRQDLARNVQPALRAMVEAAAAWAEAIRIL
ncbi:MAG: N-formylglutamate deformylase [Alphaproteobacteria bacterium]|nr:N-formylglutamate deformylase [Alphaproteobacteria bacterium]